MRLAFGPYQLDNEARTLERDGQRVAVEPKVFDLLVYLIEHRERVASSEELLDALWPGISVGPAALSGAVHKARQAVGDDGEHQAVLHTEHGRGFRFVADVAEVAAPEVAPPAPAGFRARWATAVIGLLLVAALFWLLNRQGPEALPGRSLAVLPFVNLSADPDQEYFADGIAEELLNTFARFEGLRVVGRTSSFSFRDSDADLKAIGEALGADVILEGSVRTAGDRVRITAQLVDAEDGYHRWSETYERELDDVFAIQTEIATAIASALRVRLSSEQRDRLATVPTQNLAAYQAYLLGKQRRDAQATTMTNLEAIDYFQKAIALDPEFALAYVDLARVYIDQVEDSGSSTDEMLARAQVATDKALELDDRLGEAHAVLGVIKFWRNDYQDAEAAYRRGLELSPNSAVAHMEFGVFLASELARYEEALPFLIRAVELDPLWLEAIAQVGIGLHRLGRFDESLVWFERMAEIRPGAAYGDMGFHHWRVTGRLDEAVVSWSKALALDHGNVASLTNLGKLLLDLGDPDRAESLIARAVELGPESFRTQLALEYLHLYQGDEAAALESGRKAFAIWPLYLTALPLLRDQEVRAGRYAEARALYEEHFPELLYEADPEVDARNYRAAIDLALIFSRTGEQERADLLLKRSLQQIEDIPRLGGRGYWVADVQIYALLGEKQKALSALREAIDAGWRVEWWYQLQHKPDLEPLHDEPEYQAMLEEIRADVAAQRERVKEMQRAGELTLPTELATTAAGASAGHSLAVLPFVNMSADPDQQYFADGIAEELLTTCARFGGLRVVGRTSSFSFRDSDADLKTIGEALGVDVILEGSVRTAGDRVRITAQLVNAADGFHRWSETYDRELGDIFAIQTEIATAIATALRVSLSPEERDRLTAAPTQNLAAYQAYLLGKQRMARRTSVALAESADYFQQAIELDPAFAQAHVGLADVYLVQQAQSGLPREEMLVKAQAAAERALEFDDRLGEAYNSLAFIKYHRNDFEAAVAAFELALELSPNHAPTYHWYGMLLRDDLGRPEEALALHRKALELDPLSTVIISNLGEDLDFLGRFDEALERYQSTLEIDPGFASGFLWIANHHRLVSGRLDEAVMWLGKSVSVDPGLLWSYADLGLVFLDLADPAKAEYWCNRSIDLGPENFWPNVAMQLLHLYRGDEAAALDYGRRAIAVEPRSWLALVGLRHHELRAGRYTEARALYEESHPELLSEDGPRVDNANYLQAIDLALVLSKIGEKERVDRLLNRSLQRVQTLPRLGIHGHGIADVQIYALQGDKRQALSALRRAVDEGWRSYWWYLLQHDPNLESLHDEPEYQVMLEEIRADMAAQLERVKEMQRAGELAPVPPSALPAAG